MRGEASRIADRVSRDSLAPRLRDSGEDAWRIGNELFTITNLNVPSPTRRAQSKTRLR